MKIAAYADIHTPDFKIEKIPDVDLVITLGDIDVQMLIRIARVYNDIPIYSILGNHDMSDSIIRANTLLGEERITDITLKVVSHQGVTFTGVSGSLKYKSTGIMVTQEEANQWDIPKADVLLSHDSGYKWIKRNDSVHTGLKAISRYIRKHKPRYSIFGHHHQLISFKKRRTSCICVYGMCVINLKV